MNENDEDYIVDGETNRPASIKDFGLQMYSP